VRSFLAVPTVVSFLQSAFLHCHFCGLFHGLFRAGQFPLGLGLVVATRDFGACDAIRA